MQKEERCERMPVDYYKLNQMVTPIVASVPDVVSLLKQIRKPLALGMQ